MPASQKIRRALISVYDKTGIVEFARALHDEFGVEVISTGGTAKTLTDAGIPVTLVEEITGFPELLDGRVKTLHPKIHAAILADRDNPEHMRQLKEQGIEPIDMVVVNLYPFEETIRRPECTFEEAIEMIDIGGPCLLRAAAKNYKHVLVVSDRAQGEVVLQNLRAGAGIIDADVRIELAAEAYDWTSLYDERITLYLEHTAAGRAGEPPFRVGQERLRLPIRKLHQTTRYGENPHQRGAAYVTGVMSPYHGATVLNRRELSGINLSFNNYADASAALELCAELTRAGSRMHRLSAGATQVVCCFIKHTNGCGIAVAPVSSSDPEDVPAAQLEAYRKAYLGDPNAAMGGILAVNFNVSADFAAAVMETYQRWGKPLREAGQPYAPGGFFVEVWLAPSFDEDAVRIIRGEVEGKPQKAWGKRVRLLDVGDMSVDPDPSEMDFKRIAGGVLVQDRDPVGLNEDQWKVVTEREPTEAEVNDLRLAWLICKHTKSNAITICKDGMLIGNGAGQMSRVMSGRIATWLAKENGHEDGLKGAVAASDAFFPFRDGPDVLADTGVTAIIQPGGSRRDEEVIAACNEHNIAMIFTGTRHFRH